MNANLRTLLESIVEMDGKNDLWSETTAAAKKLLEGGYEGHNEDIEALMDMHLTTGFELEQALSTGSWYWNLKKEIINTNSCTDEA